MLFYTPVTDKETSREHFFTLFSPLPISDCLRLGFFQSFFFSWSESPAKLDFGFWVFQSLLFYLLTCSYFFLILLDFFLAFMSSWWFVYWVLSIVVDLVFWALEWWRWWIVALMVVSDLGLKVFSVYELKLKRFCYFFLERSFPFHLVLWVLSVSCLFLV